ncbi:MAG: LexA family protein [Leptospirales bacterium]
MLDNKERFTRNENFKESFSFRLRKALAQTGISGHGSQTWLADIMGVSQSSARKWVMGQTLPEIEKVVLLADKLQVRLEWLISGRGCMTKDEMKEEQIVWVPVISWEDIPEWLNSSMRKDVVKTDEVPFSEKVGSDTFAVVMQGTSMEPDIMDGDVVVVDPGHPWHHQDYVLASAGDHTETIRKVILEGGKPVLTLSNPKYPSQVDSERNQILGTVAGKIRLY